jgi:hypothetical protein
VESRSASSSAATWSSTAPSATRPSRLDSRSRRAVSGLRSWWLASATNARCAEYACATVCAIRSNDAESRRSSAGPVPSATGSGAAPARTAAATRPVPSSSRCTGRSTQRTIGSATNTASASASRPAATTSDQTRTCRARSSSVGQSVTTAPSTWFSTSTGSASALGRSSHGARSGWTSERRLTSARATRSRASASRAGGGCRDATSTRPSGASTSTARP